MSEQDVVSALVSGADYLGFVLAPSKRRVQPQDVRAWLKKAEGLAQGDQGQQVSSVLVLVDASLDDIVSLALQTGVSHVQLCGNESPELCNTLRMVYGMTVWKAWRVYGDERDRKVLAYAKAVDAVLLDTNIPGVAGGSGQTFAWNEIDRIRNFLPNMAYAVAGGLTPDNVADLLFSHKADIVDVSSGIETDGHKDPHKMRRFIQEVRRVSHGSR